MKSLKQHIAELFRKWANRLDPTMASNFTLPEPIMLTSTRCEPLSVKAIKVIPGRILNVAPYIRTEVKIRLCQDILQQITEKWEEYIAITESPDQFGDGIVLTGELKVLRQIDGNEI